MGKKGKGKSKSKASAKKKAAPKKAAAAKAKSISKAKKALAPTPPPPPPPPPIEEQIVTPPEISVSTNPVERINQVMRIPDLKTYDEDEDEAPEFYDDYAHPDDCRCNCCTEY